MINNHPMLEELDRLYREYVMRHGRRPDRILIPVARAEEYNDWMRELDESTVQHLIGITVHMDHEVKQIEMRAALINGFHIARDMPKQPAPGRKQ